MLRFRPLSTLFLPFVLTLSAVSAQQPAQKLTGKWRALETSKGGIGVLLDFHRDGTMTLSPGAIVPSTHRVEEGNIVSRVSDPGTGEASEDSMTFELIGDSKLRYGKQPYGTIEMTRVGKPQDANNLLLGTWTCTSDFQGMKVASYYEFRADGTELLTIPFRKDPGRYSVEGDLIRIDVRGRPYIEGAMRWEDEVLVLPKPRGNGEMRFKRY
jgi:hypothetical protein